MTIMPAQTNALNQLPPELYAMDCAMNTLTQVAGAAVQLLQLQCSLLDRISILEEFGAEVPVEF